MCVSFKRITIGFNTPTGSDKESMKTIGGMICQHRFSWSKTVPEMSA